MQERLEAINKKLEDNNKLLISINEKVKRLESIIEIKERDNELMRKIESQRNMLNGRNIIDGRFYG